MSARVTWPSGKAFAFTIFDDTDLVTLDNAPVVYDFLRDQGFRTTKSVWPITGRDEPRVGGLTCDDPDYVRWLWTLQDEGFEIALHGVTHGTATREEIRRGLDTFRDLFGQDPDCHANHTGALDSIYWGPARLTGAQRAAYLALNRFRTEPWQGHVPGAPAFWGDMCMQRIRYVRNFVFGDINTLDACPVMPYHDPDRPFVNAWFAATEGGSIASFLDTVTPGALDRLEEEGGACIVYSHLANGFSEDGRVHDRFAAVMRNLSARNGWFVPVTTVLDHIRLQRGDMHVISARERGRLERTWLRHKLHVGGRT